MNTPTTGAVVGAEVTVARWGIVAWFVVAVAVAAAGWVAHQYGYPRTGWVVTVVAVLPLVVAYRWARKSDRLQAATRRGVGA